MLGLAKVAVLQNKNDAAIEYFERAAAGKEVFPEVYENIGFLFISLGDFTGLKQLEFAEGQMRQQKASQGKMNESSKSC